MYTVAEQFCTVQKTEHMCSQTGTVRQMHFKENLAVQYCTVCGQYFRKKN